MQFEDLGSVRGIISTFQSSFARISENFPELSLDNLGEMNLTTLLGNSSILLSELLCGHSGGIVQITENKGGMFSSGNAAEYLPEEGVSDEEKATYVYDNSTSRGRSYLALHTSCLSFQLLSVMTSLSRLKASS